MDKLSHFSLYSLLFILVISSSLIAQDKISIAVLSLQGNGVSSEEAVVLTDELRSVLVQTGKYYVLERNNMESILEEQGFQMSGCTSTECAVEAGKLLGVEKMVGGSVGKLGALYNLSIRIFDVETGRIEKTVSKRHEGSIEELLDLIKQIGYELSEMIIEESTDITSEYESLQKGKTINKFTHRRSRFSVKAGISSTTTTRHSTDKIGIVVGGAYNLHLINNISLQPEIIYATRHFEYFSSEETIHFDNLQFALLFSYYVVPLSSKNFILSFNAGPSYNFFLNGTKEAYGETYDLENYENDKAIKSSEVSFLFGPALGIQFGNVLVSIEGRYELGLTEIFIDESYWEVGKAKVFWGILGITF